VAVGALAALAAAAALGCPRAGAPAPAEGTAAPAGRPGVRRLPPGGAVGVVTRDGVRLHGEWRTPAGRAPPYPALLLLHDVAGDVGQFDPAWAGFEARGWAALAIDLRGHGGSTARDDGRTISWEKMGPFDVAAMPMDVWAALDWLRAHPDVDHTRIAVVGAGLGANLAWVASGTEWGVQAAVALSPGVRVSPAGEDIADLEPRGVLIVAGELDPGAAAAARGLAARSAGSHRLLIVRGTSGHGTDLLEPGLGAGSVVLPEVVTWIERRWVDLSRGTATRSLSEAF
jgi:dienelactone hydrolase